MKYDLGDSLTKAYLVESKEILNELKTDYNGLSEEESEIRLEKEGLNKLDEANKTSLIMKFVKELTNPMIIILIIASIVSGITAAYANESFADVFIIFIVVIINGILGVYQENKSEKAIMSFFTVFCASSYFSFVKNSPSFLYKNATLLVATSALIFITIFFNV